jgi:hypothetical protein
MVLYPDVQKRAQSEIDRVIGSDRLPTFEDRDQLPYIEAVVKEVLRWQPVAPLGEVETQFILRNIDPSCTHPGLPHLVTQDDIHAGYFIPKGTTIFANIWYTSLFFGRSEYQAQLSTRSILHDPKTYPNPEVFEPGRYVTETGEPTGVPDAYEVCFGYGRRLGAPIQLRETWF